MLQFKKTLFVSLFFFILALIFLVEALITPHLNYILPFVGYGGTFRYNNYTFFEKKISLYLLTYIIGIVSMMIMCIYRARKYQIRYWLAITVSILLAFFGCLGAKIMYILENYDYASQNKLTFGGMSFFGTLFFMLFIIPIIAIIFKKKPAEFLDYCTPAGLVMLTCVRFGCFLKGCCGGVTYWIMNRPIIVPVQLIECTLDILLLAFLFFIEEKKIYKGKLYFIFIGGYGMYRFFLEMLRNTPKTILLFSHGQCFSIICICIMCIALFTGKNKKLPNQK